MGLLAWLIVGLIAVRLAGVVMKGGGDGVLVYIIFGILGGLLGGRIVGKLGIWSGGGMSGSTIVAFIGAVNPGVDYPRAQGLMRVRTSCASR
jgi:uncharacterized membrane protein YeaQ/YmgE (transglycosylase-associated protein family)